ncbi:hypothetical protein HanXRQr2_Chr09g0385701 [Helianthus annuus]|uniref:Uncharacterized protein n=1 Tax=Helianthus annuus TaxID=4232 RepID=A0A9K3I6D9_HELAN|nr:hypothetical protein HanXRQr2_Chr09g0385701 [Helianthus annuus]
MRFIGSQGCLVGISLSKPLILFHLVIWCSVVFKLLGCLGAW